MLRFCKKSRDFIFKIGASKFLSVPNNSYLRSKGAEMVSMIHKLRNGFLIVMMILMTYMTGFEVPVLIY